MFGGQNFHDFARGQGSNVDLDEILRQMFGGAGGFGRGGFSLKEDLVDLEGLVNQT